MKKEHAGFTGTQVGVTDEQKATFAKLIKEYKTFTHGDCIGADDQAHIIAKEAGLYIKVRPCTIYYKRVFHDEDEVFKEKPPLERNRDIVDTCDCLFAMPDSFKEKLRSGTWSTIRYARTVGKPIVIIWPDGTIKKENHE